MFDLTGSGFEPLTSRTKAEQVTALAVWPVKELLNKYYYRLSIKDKLRSQRGGGRSVRTFCGQGRIRAMWTSAFLNFKALKFNRLQYSEILIPLLFNVFLVNLYQTLRLVYDL